MFSRHQRAEHGAEGAWTATFRPKTSRSRCCASSAGATSTTSCWRPTRPCREDLRLRPAAWRDGEAGFDAWREGRTGYPLVDAGMRQLMREGFMHNRARLVASSFLTEHLGVDWRRGAAHFYEHLVAGDVANNSANWQRVVGSGADYRPNRILSPARQAERFDPDGVYARRYVPELATPDYPAPIVAHEAAFARFRGALA